MATVTHKEVIAYFKQASPTEAALVLDLIHAEIDKAAAIRARKVAGLAKARKVKARGNKAAAPAAPQAQAAREPAARRTDPNAAASAGVAVSQ